VQKALEYYQLVLNILRVTKFMTSSISVLQASLCEYQVYMIKSYFKI